MFAHGIKASKLIEELQRMIDRHGDKEVYAGGGDYPEGVDGVYYQKRDDDPYVPADSFIVR